jgi:hypothetical protein
MCPSDRTMSDPDSSNRTKWIDVCVVFLLGAVAGLVYYFVAVVTVATIVPREVTGGNLNPAALDFWELIVLAWLFVFIPWGILAFLSRRDALGRAFTAGAGAVLILLFLYLRNDMVSAIADGL